MKDERIFSLLESNNELSLELTQKNQFIEILQNNIVPPKNVDSKEVQENPIAYLTKRITGQKSSYANTFKGKQYLDDSFAASVEYVESVEIPSETDISGDYEKYVEVSKKLKTILCNFNRAREKYCRRTEFLKEISQSIISESTQTDPVSNTQNELQLAFEAQKQTIQKLENEIKTLKGTIVADADAAYLTVNESETVETTATNDFSDGEPPIQSNDLSTQTDFSPKISIDVYKRLYSIEKLSNSNHDHLQALQQKVKACNVSLGGSINAFKKKIEDRFAAFEDLAFTNKSFVKVKNRAEMDKLKHLNDWQELLPSQIEIFELVKNDKQASAALYFSDSTLSAQESRRNCSSQTEISILRLGLSFEEIEPKDTYEVQIAKLHGEYIQLLSDHAVHMSHAKRLRTYVEDLSDGKETAVLESDLSDQLKDLLHKGISSTVKNSENQDAFTKSIKWSSSSKVIADMQLMQTEIFAQLEKKVKSTLNFEIDAALKKSTESFRNLQFMCYRSDETSIIDKLNKELSDKNNHISEQSKKILSLDNKNAEAEKKIRYETSDKNLANLKLKE